MPWKDVTLMSQRTEFLKQAHPGGVNLSALCREFGISRKTGYKWLQREATAGTCALADRSRRPQSNPSQTSPALEARVLSVREAHPDWGGRKIRRVLQNDGEPAVPAASTITAILHRHQLIDPEEAHKHTAWQRFERAWPNELWQMDFKGPVELSAGGSCHPLTVLDDHSRFLVGLKACPDETLTTVQAHLTAIFEQYGLPEGFLMDNGSPWGYDLNSRHTRLTVWLMRLGIAITHGRPFHPQTQGKDERLNRTLKTEVLSHEPLTTLAESQTRFDQWRTVYNEVRPHEALQLDTPAAHYQPSPRPFPAVLPAITYEAQDWIRQVDASGKISLHNHAFRVSRAFAHQPVAVRPSGEAGGWDVFFCQFKVAHIQLHEEK
jgi:transposase InsO family protein